MNRFENAMPGFAQAQTATGVGLSNATINNRILPIVGTAILSTAAGSYFLASFSFWPILILSILAYIACIFTSRVPVVGPMVFYTFAFLEGGLLVPLLKLAAITIHPAGVALCFIVTSGIFFGLAGFAMVTNKDFTHLGGFLVFGLLAIILLQVLNLFFHFMGGTAMLLLSSCTIFLMCGFILYDISSIKKNFTDQDYVFAAMQLYLDFVIIFQELLKLAIMSQSSRD